MVSRILGLFVLLGLAAVTVPVDRLRSQTSADQEKAVSFNIPPGDVFEVVVYFFTQSGARNVDVNLTSAQQNAIASQKSPGVTAVLPPREALKRLLSGTGLTFLDDGAGGYYINRIEDVRVPGGRCVRDAKQAPGVCTEK